MNKRSLLSFAMCSLLLGSLPVGLVGCKDYDGDIKKLDTTTGNLSSQVSTLQSALDAAKQAADAAANDAKAAAAKADSATQEVALAKQAVEEAKAEAIQTALDAIKDGNFASTDDLAALSGKLEGIETGLSKIQADFTESQKAIAELNKQISAMDVQIKALEKLKEDMASLDGLSEKVAAIDGITAELNQLKADAAANKTSVAEVKSQLANVSSEISTQVTNAVNSIAGILAQRLTSVTLVPELYVGGVPTIEFETAEYNKLVWKANKDLPAKGTYEYATQKVNGVDQIVTGLITNHAVEAKYRLNPSTITASDIDLDALAYVTEVATFRTRAEEKPKFAVSGAEIGANGLLTVKLDNLVPGKFREGLLNDNRYSTYEDLTASLRVPVAKKHLFENETEAVVYSEFVRMTEKAFNPYLGLSYQSSNRGGYYVYNLANNLKGWPYESTNNLYNSYEQSYVVKRIAYNASYNLNDLFIGIMGDVNGGVTYQPDTIANPDLATYGLAIRYKIADGSYVPYNSSNGVDQQKYAKLSGEGNCILTPQTPTGVTANQAIIGKAPILLAEMYDIKTGNIVDAEYFKVMFTAQEVEDITFTFPIKEYKGDACEIYHDLTWEYMTANLLEKLNNGEGMSQTEFTTIYDWPYYTSIPDTEIPTAFVSNSQGNSGWLTSPDVPALRIYANENNLPKLVTGNNALTYGNVLVFEPRIAGYPTIKVTINWTPTLNVKAATFGDAMATVWGTNNTMQIRVKPMTDTQTTAEYGTNILAGRIKPYVNNLLGCATYSINYAPTKEQDAALMKALNNYVGQPLEFTGVANGAISKANQNDLTSVLYSLDKSNANARKLVCDGGTIKVNWTSNINGLEKNNYNIGTINLQVLPILKYTNGKVASITPALTPVDATMAIQLLDAYNNVVAETSTKENPNAAAYWSFYGIESVTYGATEGNPIKIGSGDQTYANATKLSDTVFDVTISGNKITFISNGYSVTTASKIYVPFVAKHAWGELKGYAVVDLKVTPGSN